MHESFTYIVNKTLRQDHNMETLGFYTILPSYTLIHGYEGIDFAIVPNF